MFLLAMTVTKVAQRVAAEVRGYDDEYVSPGFRQQIGAVERDLRTAEEMAQVMVDCNEDIRQGILSGNGLSNADYLSVPSSCFYYLDMFVAPVQINLNSLVSSYGLTDAEASHSTDKIDQLQARIDAATAALYEAARVAEAAVDAAGGRHAVLAALRVTSAADSLDDLD